MIRHREPASASRREVYLVGAVVAVVCAVVLAVVRSRRTGFEVGLVAVALAAFGVRPHLGDARVVLTIVGWVALLAVAVVAIEPHLHS